MLLALLAACQSSPKPTPDTAVGCERAWYADLDGDGFGDPGVWIAACEPVGATVADATDCDDADATVHPGATEDCTAGRDQDCDGDVGDGDADLDGSPACADCDDADPARFPGAPEHCDGTDEDCDIAVDDDPVDGDTWWEDADGDGWGNVAVSAMSCEAPPGFVATFTDCDDTDPTISPDAVEVCDGVDADCDGTIDDEALDAPSWYPDDDGDGYGATDAWVDACTLPEGASTQGGDCDDADDQVSPGVDEQCNGQDDDCDGLLDDADDPVSGRSTWYLDADGDGFGDPAAARDACDVPYGYLADDTDCDDGDAAAHPGADEVCGGGDEDCDGTVDQGARDASTWYRDDDGDGYGDPTAATLGCSPAGHVPTADDCDDTDAAVSPGAVEQCNHYDDDCDGEIDAEATDATDWHPDEDGDGWGGPDTTTACTAPAGWLADGSDCDDADDTVSPDASETCDGIDEDCDGTVDEDATDADAWYQDDDADGYGDGATWACEAPVDHVAYDGDCDDADPAVHPGAPEDCAGPDLNCDGQSGTGDGDGDGWAACEECDDGDAAISPDGLEVCNGSDDDCDGTIDEGGSAWYADADRDGYGDPAAPSVACSAPSSHVADATDCDDGDAAVHPGAAESCATTADDDCDGATNVEDAGDCTPYALDHDADGYGIARWECWCEPTGLATADTDDDCDDTTADAHPGAREAWGTGIDEDCDGEVDVLHAEDADIAILGETTGDGLGQAVRPAGDVDGDGWEDLLVGAPMAQASGTVDGAAYVLRGPLAEDVSVAEADVTIEAEAAEWSIGRALAGQGDLDGDGVSDVLIAAVTAGSASEGRVYTLLGPLSAVESLALADGTVTGASAGDQAGWSVAIVGDTDGDGLDDALMGVVNADDGGLNAGAAALVLGPATGAVTTTAADAWLYGEMSGDEAGIGVAGAGDLDGDGLDDVLVGAAGYDQPVNRAGAVYVLLGPITGTLDLAAADASFQGAARNMSTGEALAGTGDLDGDGLDDLAVGAAGSRGAGAVYLLSGAVTGTHSVSEAFATFTAGSGERLGCSVAAPGDVDGDGEGDLVLGDNEAPDPSGYTVGAAWLVFGPFAGAVDVELDGSAVRGREADDYAGVDVAGGTDLDGDGAPDVLVGVSGGDGVETEAGVALVFLGR